MTAARRCFLVRHGEAAAHWGEAADPGLSERGREQAQAAAAALAAGALPAGFDLVTSPRARARETAAPFATLSGLRPRVEPAFGEVPAPVPLAGRRDWLRAFMAQGWHEQDDPAVLRWRRDLLAALRALERPAVIFTHFLVINAAAAEAEGSDRVLRFWPDNGSIHEFEVAADGGLRLLSRGAELETRVG